MRRGAWGPFIYFFVCLFIYLFLNLAEAAASAASMQFTALITACKIGCLCSKGDNVNTTDAKGWTALMFAARNGHADVASILLEKG